MRIPNKFNGYALDGRRLYNDPATLAIGAGLSTGTMAGTALLTTGAVAGSTAALGAGLAAGLAAGGLGTGATSLLGGALPGGIASQAGAGGLGSMTGATAPTITTASGAPAFTPGVTATTSPQGIASAFDPNQYLASSGFEPVKATGVGKDVAAFDLNQMMGLNPSSSPVSSTTPNLADTIRNVQTQAQGSAPISYPAGGQGIAPNALPIQTAATPIQPGANFLTNAGNLIQNPSWQGAKDFAMEHPYATSAAAALAARALFSQPTMKAPEQDPGMIRPYTMSRTTPVGAYDVPLSDTSERRYFTDTFTAGTPYRAAEGGIASAYAIGGPIETMSAMNAVGGNLGYPQSQFQTDIYSNPGTQRPEVMNMIAPSGDVPVDPYTGEQKFARGGVSDAVEDAQNSSGEYKYTYDPKTMQFTQLSDPKYDAALKAYQQSLAAPMGGMNWGQPQPVLKKPEPFVPITTGGISAPVGGAPTSVSEFPTLSSYQTARRPYVSPEEQLGLTGFYDMMNSQLRGYAGYAGGGEISDLGGYSDGGRLLKGPGDGVSDSIPAVIGKRQPARLADGEFVIPARIVSELGNGSTEAGARKLYAMMDRVQKRRKKSVGKGKVAVDSKADKLLPA
jgi:hypothetical protein